MKDYGEYCPVAMGAEAIGDRWTPLVLRELLCGSERFSDIHRGVPRISRTLLTQRLRQLERGDLIERTERGGYRLTEAGRALEPVIMGMGEWATRFLLGDPAKEHDDGAHLLWRVRQRLVPEALPKERTVIQFDLGGARRGSRIWLILDPQGPDVCERDEGFEVDLTVRCPISVFQRIWTGLTTWDEAIADGSLVLDGPRPLVRAFPTWFALGHFAALVQRPR